MERYDRRARELVMWVAVIWLCFWAFALGVWCAEKNAEEPAYIAGEPEIVTVPVPEPVEGDPLDAPQEDREKVLQDAGAKAPEDNSEKPVPDPMCEDSYLREDHPLPIDLQVMLYGACLEFQVEYELALAVIEQETRFNNVLGDDGESAGYMQVQKKWHQERMALLGVDDLMDPEGNFRVGCHFLKECIDKYGVEKGLGYYNSGKAQVTDYSRQVLGRMQ